MPYERVQQKKTNYAKVLTVNKVDNKFKPLNIPNNSEMKSTLKCYPQFKLNAHCVC